MIPAWNMAGVIPPIRPNQLGSSNDRSPYAANMRELIETYAFSLERARILEGFIQYRQEIYSAGVAQGFQWLNGSFMQAKEATLGMPPSDIDVVTFFKLPASHTQITFHSKNPDLFNSFIMKKKFLVDAYSHIIGKPLELYDVKMISYWYSMWSHRKNDNLWKGFVKVDLDPTEEANLLLSHLNDAKKFWGLK
jgi:hypothetical protein